MSSIICATKILNLLTKSLHKDEEDKLKSKSEQVHLTESVYPAKNLRSISINEMFLDQFWTMYLFSHPTNIKKKYKSDLKSLPPEWIFELCQGLYK